jgi:putative peptidoglycan binding protein
MRARVLVPLVAAVLGIAGGVATALVMTPDAGSDASDRSEASDRSDPVRDPLHLGIPLVDQGCTGESLLIVGYGSSAAQLGSAVADNGKTGLAYLASADSCATILGPEGEAQPPDYVVYLGPYNTRQEPCEKRMTPEHRGDFVTVLRAGNDTLVKCVCALPRSAGPELRVGMEPTEKTVIWIRSLQQMLHDYYPDDFTPQDVTVVYDQHTADMVTRLQQEARGVLTEPGVVDTATWGIISDRICRTYDF